MNLFDNLYILFEIYLAIVGYCGFNNAIATDKFISCNCSTVEFSSKINTSIVSSSFANKDVHNRRYTCLLCYHHFGNKYQLLLEYLNSLILILC